MVPDARLEAAPGGVSIVRVSDYGYIEDVAKAYLDGLSTHWRWWIDADKGGYEAALREVKEWIESGSERRHAALAGNSDVVGAAGYAPHPRLANTAWLAGVAVKPGHRLGGWAGGSSARRSPRPRGIASGRRLSTRNRP